MLGWTEIIVIGLIVLLFVSPSRIANAARAIGQSIKEAKKAIQTIDVQSRPIHSQNESKKESQRE